MPAGDGIIHTRLSRILRVRRHGEGLLCLEARHPGRLPAAGDSSEQDGSREGRIHGDPDATSPPRTDGDGARPDAMSDLFLASSSQLESPAHPSITKKNRAQFLDWTAKLGVESISSEGPERFVHLIARFRVRLCPELQGWVMVGDRS